MTDQNYKKLMNVIDEIELTIKDFNKELKEIPYLEVPAEGLFSSGMEPHWDNLRKLDEIKDKYEGNINLFVEEFQKETKNLIRSGTVLSNAAWDVVEKFYNFELIFFKHQYQDNINSWRPYILPGSFQTPPALETLNPKNSSSIEANSVSIEEYEKYAKSKMIDASSELEHLLSRLGASEKGLGKKTKEIEHIFHDLLKKDIELIVKYRNIVTHDRCVPTPNMLKSLIETCELCKAELIKLIYKQNYLP